MKLRMVDMAGVAALVLALNAYGEGPGVTDKSVLIGSWVLEGTAIRKDGNITAESSKWEFTNDGQLNTTSYYKFGNKLAGEGSEGHTADTYEIKDGKLVRGQGGTFEFVELQGNKMILKNAGLFYFLKKE